MLIRRYQKKGSFDIVEATQVSDRKTWPVYAEWCDGSLDRDEEVYIRLRKGYTPNDRAYYLDYIVKGVDDKFFAVSPENFIKNYTVA